MTNIASNSERISSRFMGLPFAGMSRDLQFKAMGNPTNITLINAAGQEV